MRKELEIAQVNEMKFYLNWDYVKEICNEAIREENKKLEKQLKIAKKGLTELKNYGDCNLDCEIAAKCLKQIKELDK